MCCRSQFVARNICELSERYQLGSSVLGQGGRGQVVKAKHVRTGRVFAVKVISKKPTEGLAEYPTVEIDIMKSMDHPHIAKLFETFEDDHNVYLVLEACRGGTVEDIKNLTEDQVARIMKQVLYAVRYMHKNSISHGDLNTSNILLESTLPVEKNNIKIIDFGLAKRTHDISADVEACGSILRSLLGKVGTIAKGVRATDPDSKVFNASGVEVEVSQAAGDLIRSFSSMEPMFRCSIAGALCHPWFKKRVPRSLGPKQAKLLPDIVDRIKQFSRQNKFKRAVLHIIADHFPGEQTDILRDLFVYLDGNSDGVVTPKELKKALKKKCDMKPSGLTAAMRTVDADDIGPLEYTAFLAATIDLCLCETEDVCKDAFDVFDRDGNGQISQEEIAHMLCDKAVKGSMTAKSISKLVKEDLDQNGDGVVSFNEFVAFLRDEPNMASGIYRASVHKASIDAMAASASPLERAAPKRLKLLAMTHKSKESSVKQKDKKRRKNESSKKISQKIPAKRERTGSLAAVATEGKNNDAGKLDDLLGFEDLEDVDEDDEDDSDDDSDSEENDLRIMREGGELPSIGEEPEFALPVPPPPSARAVLMHGRPNIISPGWQMLTHG